MADLPDTLVFATLPSAQRCAGGHYRQAGSMPASTHMMPSSFWCCYSSVLSLFFNHKPDVYRHVRSGSPPPMPCIRLVGASVSEPHTNGVAGACWRCVYLSYVKEAPGVRIRHAQRRRPANNHTRRAHCGTRPRPTSRPTVVVDVGRDTAANTRYQS